MSQLIGSVRWFNNVKGYGFIGHEGGADVFCHFSSIQHDGYKSLKEGDVVLFEIVQGEKGPQSDKVMHQKGVRAVESNLSAPPASEPEGR